jgi:hypothetical protein
LAVALIVASEACGESDHDTLDRSGGCPADGSTEVRPPVSDDGVVYLDEGIDTFVPSLDAPVPGLGAIAGSGENLFLARIFRRHAADNAGAVDIVEMKADVRSDRCSVRRRWSSKGEDFALAHLGVFGSDVYFRGEEPTAFPIAGGEPTRLTDVPLTAFVVDSAIIVGAVEKLEPGTSGNLLFGPRSGTLRSIGTFNGLTEWPLLTQDDVSVYVGGRIDATSGMVTTIDKHTGDVSPLVGFDKSCREVVAAGGALWGLCSATGATELVHRDPTGNTEVLATLRSNPRDLVADGQRAWWVEAAGGPSRVVSLDARAPRDARGEVPAQTVVDELPVRTMLLARSGAWLYVATEEAGCLEPMPSGKVVICARERVTVRVTRRPVSP